MSNSFDPYQEWLGISPREQPPHYYRLLGIRPFERDPDTINAAADRRMVLVKHYQITYPEQSQDLLDTLSRARVCLLDALKKAAYDRELRSDYPELRNIQPRAWPRIDLAIPTTPYEPDASDTDPTAEFRPVASVKPVVFQPMPRVKRRSSSVSSDLPPPDWSDSKLVAPEGSTPRQWGLRSPLVIYAGVTGVSLVVIVFVGWLFLGGWAERPATQPGLVPTIKHDSAPKAGESFRNSIGMKLVYIPAGEFLMGSPNSERYRNDAQRNYDELQHRVRLSKSIYLGSTEVTQSQWQAVMETTPWQGRDLVREGSTYAADWLSWRDATEFCRRLSELEGRKYRLPTEAEWEYACRAGTRTAYYFGDDSAKLQEYAWFDEPKFANMVGLKRSNAWGLYDMYGNVMEWCGDWYGWDYYRNSASTDPRGPSSGLRRTIRGGVSFYFPGACRSAARNWNDPTRRRSRHGFRVVCELD